MSEQEEFFSKKHNQLLNIATWAKYLAWAILIFFIFFAVMNIPGNLTMYNQLSSRGSLTFNSFTDMFFSSPVVVINVFFESLSILIKGFVFYVVLKGISLGLNMIVETDINYREKLNQGGEQ